MSDEEAEDFLRDKKRRRLEEERQARMREMGTPTDEEEEESEEDDSKVRLVLFRNTYPPNLCARFFFSSFVPVQIGSHLCSTW